MNKGMGYQSNQVEKFKQPFQVLAFYGFQEGGNEPVIDYLGGYRPDRSRRRGKVLVTQGDMDHIIADVLEMYKNQIDEDIFILYISDKDGKHVTGVKHPGDFINDDGNIRYEVQKTIN